MIDISTEEIFEIQPYINNQNINEGLNDQYFAVQTQNLPNLKSPSFRYYLPRTTCEEENEAKKDIKKYKKIKKGKAIQPLESNKKTAIMNIFGVYDADHPITMDCGLYISKDGFVRLNYTTNLVSFGFSFYEINTVSYQKESNLIQVQSRPAPQPRLVSTEQAMEFLANTPCKNYSETRSALQNYAKFKDSVYESIRNIQISDSLLGLKDAETFEFINKAKKYMQSYSDTHENDIFMYQIGRVDYISKKISINHTGYSKSFLDLIGVDVDNFSQILLRHQKIDLVPDREEIMKQSIFCMNQHLLNEYGVPMSFNIQTFDGFPLRIQSTNRFHYLSNFHYKRLIDIPIEYIIKVVTIEVDLHDLQNLISYRERLLSNSNELSFEDFMKKELSFFFENVEYSVRSQAFIERYYAHNIKKLQEMNDKLQNRDKQLSQSNTQTIDESKQCKYAFINQQRNNTFEIY